VEQACTTAVYPCGAISVAVVATTIAVVAATQIPEGARPILGRGESVSAASTAPTVPAATAAVSTAAVATGVGVEMPAVAAAAATTSAASSAAFFIFSSAISLDFHEAASWARRHPGFKQRTEGGNVQKRLSGHPPPGVGMEDVIHEVGQLLGAVGPVGRLRRTVAGPKKEAFER